MAQIRSIEQEKLNEKIDKIIKNQTEILKRLNKIEYTILGTISHCMD